MKGEIVVATLDHARELAPRLRLNDALEWRAQHPKPALDLLSESLAGAARAWAGLVDGRVVCLFGLSAPCVLSDRATAWLFASPEVEQCRKTFWRGSREMVAHMKTLYPQLESWCDARFEASTRWLERLGFRLESTQVIAGMPFHHFEMKA